MTERNKIEVVIDGRNFTVIGSDNEDYVRSVARYVDKKIKEMARKNDRLCQTSSAILAALNIADELHRTKDLLSDLESQAKDPMEKYGDVRLQLEEAKKNLEELKGENSNYKKDLLESENEVYRLKNEMERQKEAMGLKEKELLDNQSMIKSLQDKVFDNQMELIETKKELRELLDPLDKGKNTLAKGEA